MDNRTIRDDKELSNAFNIILIVQNTTGTAPVKTSSKCELNNKFVIEEIIKTYEKYKLIEDNVLSEDKNFTMEPATVMEINKIIKHLKL